MLTRLTGYDLVSRIKFMEQTRSLNDPCVCFSLIPKVWDHSALATRSGHLNAEKMLLLRDHAINGV